MRRLILVFVALSLTFCFFTPTDSFASNPKPLSDYGNAAIGELATCLRTSSSLDVFYLIDASLSLADGPGRKGTDNEKKRKDIIAQDIKRWAEIAGYSNNLNVNVAGAFFNSSAFTLSNWQQLTKNNADSVASSFANKIENQKLGNYTNWRAGLQSAYDAMKSRTATCKAVIWFTDGGLWSAPGDRLSNSLNEVAELCGTSKNGDVPTSDSASGLMAKIRRSGIHVYGILLHKPSAPKSKKDKKEEEVESFYRSLMQPLIEEKGQLSNVPANLEKEMKCGENLEGESKDYAAGAFLEAASPAEVAFKFMKIAATVQDGTEQECSKDGHFYVDPGIAFIEFATDASSWKIVDAENKIVKQSQNVVGGTTSKVTIPTLKESTDWKFIPSPSGGLCSLFVYPELHLVLHDKALVGGRESSITGQFVASATSGEKANLKVFKKVSFSAKVDGFAQDASLNADTANFEIKNYKPQKDAKSVIVTGKLDLETEHYILAPVELRQSKEVNSPQLLPEVGAINFGEPLYGADGKTTATVSIKAPEDTSRDSQVCFETPKVIGDHQDESSGASTNRDKFWGWKPVNLDAQNCINFLRGTNRDQTIKFELSNPKQANAQGEALFQYRFLSDGVDAIKTSQTSAFETKEKRSGGMFWAILIFCLILGFGIPWVILWFLNKMNSVYSIANLMRVELPVIFDPNYKTLSTLTSNSIDELELPEQFKNVITDKDVVSTFSDPSSSQVSRYGSILSSGSLFFSAKPRLWPLSRPQFSATPGVGVFVAIKNQVFAKNSNTRALTSNNLSKIAYFSCSTVDLVAAARNGSQLQGALVVFSTRPSIMSGSHFKGNVDDAIKNQAIKQAISEALEANRNRPEDPPSDIGGGPSGFGGGPTAPVSPLTPIDSIDAQGSSAEFDSDLLKDI